MRSGNSRCWTGGLSKSHTHPSYGGICALQRSDNSILHFHTALCLLDSIGGRKREGTKEEKGEESHTEVFIPSPFSPFHLNSSSSHPHAFKAASLLFSSFTLCILGKSLSELEKGPWGHQCRVHVSFFFFLPPPPFWIIDSCCLVIHRLHMPANSSGGRKLPTPQPCTHPKHTHNKSHTSPCSVAYMRAYTETHTSQVRVKPRHHHHHHRPLKSQELGMRRGSKRHVSR